MNESRVATGALLIVVIAILIAAIWIAKAGGAL